MSQATLLRSLAEIGGDVAGDAAAFSGWVHSLPNAPRVWTSLNKRFALHTGQPQRFVRGPRRLVRTPSIGGASHLKILDIYVSSYIDHNLSMM